MTDINIRKTFEGTEEDNMKKLLEVFEIIFGSICNEADNK